MSSLRLHRIIRYDVKLCSAGASFVPPPCRYANAQTVYKYKLTPNRPLSCRFASTRFDRISDWKRVKQEVSAAWRARANDHSIIEAFHCIPNIELVFESHPGYLPRSFTIDRFRALVDYLRFRFMHYGFTVKQHVSVLQREDEELQEIMENWYKDKFHGYHDIMKQASLDGTMYDSHANALWTGSRTAHRLVTLDQLQQHSDEDLAKAICLVGVGYLYLFPKMAISAQGTDDRTADGLILHAWFCLDIATRLGCVDAAAVLCTVANGRLASEEPTKSAIENAKANSQLQLAEDLVSKTIQTMQHNTPWPILSAFTCTRFAPQKLQRQSPAKLIRMLRLLNVAVHNPIEGDFRLMTNPPGLRREKLEYSFGEKAIPPSFKERREKAVLIPREEPPASSMARILKHCLGTRKSAFSRDQVAQLIDWRENIVLPWAEQSKDPELCALIALREEDFGTDRWLRLITAGTKFPSPHPAASWLSAIYHWRRDGLLDFAEWPDQSRCIDPRPIGPSFMKSASESSSSLGRLKAWLMPTQGEPNVESEGWTSSGRLAHATWDYPIFPGMDTDTCYVICCLTGLALGRLVLTSLDKDTSMLPRESLASAAKFAESKGLSHRSRKQFERFRYDLLEKSDLSECKKWVESYTTAMIEDCADVVMANPEMQWLDVE